MKIVPFFRPRRDSSALHQKVVVGERLVETPLLIPAPECGVCHCALVAY